MNKKKNNTIIISTILSIIFTLIIIFGCSIGIIYFINKDYKISNIITETYIGDITISSIMEYPLEYQLRDQINKYNHYANNNFKIISIEKSDKDKFNEMVTVGTYKWFNKSKINLYFNIYKEESKEFHKQPDTVIIHNKAPSIVTDSILIGLWANDSNNNAYDFISSRSAKKSESGWYMIIKSYVPWIKIYIPSSAIPNSLLVQVEFEENK